MSEVKTILHLGLGAFHRAHQAAYLQRLHDLGDLAWSITSANIRPATPDPAALLLEQGCAYTLETISPAGARAYQLVSAIGSAIAYDPALTQVLLAGSDPATRIISFTVTEAGYFLDAGGRLQLSEADLGAARSGHPGATIYSVLGAVLRERRRRGSGPVTLLCCDNLRHNGKRFRHGFMQFLALLDEPALAAWVEENTSCPNGMVDRITPRTPPELAERVRAATGRIDAAPVMCETFTQWVIEDDFCNGRPDLERAGVQLVASVAPYEEAKIRILNATHSCIAWAGALAGHRLIHECMRDPLIHRIAHDYVSKAVFECLSPSPVDLAQYRDQVFERFGSDAIADTTERVLADSFAKLPGFIVPTIRERLSRGLEVASVMLLPALFLRFLLRWHAGELALTYTDQAMDPATVDAICRAADPAAAFARQRPVWGELADDGRVLAALRAAMKAV